MRMLSRKMGCWIWLAGCLVMGPTFSAAQDTRVQPEQVKLALQIAGEATEVAAHLYKPPGDGPFPLVIFSHGRSAHPAERAKLTQPVLVGHANYWLKKGVAVVAPLRPGYGETGGPDRENALIRWDGSTCIGNPDYTRVARHARETIAATHQWAQQQAWVNKDRILLEGHSMGGLASVAAGALNLPGVVGVVNFSGGTGGDTQRSPGKSCLPENLTQAYALFGQQTKIPNLWLYAENDQFWGAELPKQWFEAFKAGGSPARFILTPPLEGHDGHRLLANGGRLWFPHLEAFAKETQLLSN